MIELEKLRQRVDEFNENGELDMMQQYVADVRGVQRRLVDVQEQITWINKVSLVVLTLVKMFMKFRCHCSCERQLQGV